MATYTQANRPLAIRTPLGPDVLLLTGFRGQEAISQLFDFQVDLLAEAFHEIHFDHIIGQNVTVELRLSNEQKRYFNGLVKRFSQGGRDETFLHFRAEIVPKLWLLTRKFRSRIFQQVSVPDILRQVLAGLDVSYELSATYYPRDYCVQYRETDFDFASRLMEEEGIYYFFKHSNGSHEMVVTDVPTQHPTVPGQSSVIYDEVSGGGREDLRITLWDKSQELRSGQYTLWDHCFELPGKHLEANKEITDSVTAGKVTHKLSVGGNDQLEIYDYPGGYAQRFDGIDRNGAPQPQDLQDILPDSERTVKVRMEQEAVGSLEIHGASNCGQFVAGHHFTLKRHFDADGQYVLTRVEHDAHLDGEYRTDQGPAFTYENRFTCIPGAMPYRPLRLTSKPIIAGIQTATVVGPQGEEIYCDKYGRIKVQFHWDREGKKDANSSCWLRVAQVWAGKGWGAFFWPRIGHEVVVIFEEGDPDQPLIIGCVYNAENMPPFELPKAKMIGGFRSASLHGNPQKNFNGIILVDAKDHEHLAIHSERHMVFNAEFDKLFRAGRHVGERVPGARILTVGSLPGGGGSGGGPNDNLYPTPEPQAIFGINSAVVYGSNFQIATPLNFQLAFGSNLQICANPFACSTIMSDAPAAAASPLVAGLLGSGLGGNMQLTLGTSANLVMGQLFDINLGPRRIVIDAHKNAQIQPAAVKVGKLIGAVIIVFVIAYPLLPGDDVRAALLVAFQLTIQGLLESLMDFQKLYNLSDKEMKAVYDKTWKTPGDPENHQALDAFLDGGWNSAANASPLALMALPVVLDSIGEIRLDFFSNDSQSQPCSPPCQGKGAPPPPPPPPKNGPKPGKGPH